MPRIDYEGPSSADELQRLDNVLADTSTTPRTRRWLLERASLAAVGAGVAGIAAACGGSSKPATSATTTQPMEHGDTPAKVLNTAITAEALAVTYLTAVIAAAPGTKVEPFLPVLKAANAAEYDHYKALKSLGAKPLTQKFWAPNDFFGQKLANVFPTIEVAETLFVNAYLIGINVFSNAKMDSAARYAGEILGTEAEHRTLARYAQGKLPNNVGFEDYSVKSMDGIVSALEKVGVGFGKQGSKPGKFVSFSPPPASALTAISEEAPQ